MVGAMDNTTHKDLPRPQKNTSMRPECIHNVVYRVTRAGGSGCGGWGRQVRPRVGSRLGGVCGFGSHGVKGTGLAHAGKRMGAFTLRGIRGPTTHGTRFGPKRRQRNNSRVIISFRLGALEARTIKSTGGRGDARRHLVRRGANRSCPNRGIPGGAIKTEYVGPRDGTVSVRRGSRYGSTEERSTARSPVDPVH